MKSWHHLVLVCRQVRDKVSQVQQTILNANPALEPALIPVENVTSDIDGSTS